MDLLNDCGFSFSFSGLLKFYSKAEKSRTKIQDEAKHVFANLPACKFALEHTVLRP